MMVIPAGMGKTRISLATCIGLMTRVKANKIVVVYLNKLLMRQDEQPWNIMEKYMAKNKEGEDVQLVRVDSWSKALEHHGSSTIYVIDEADRFFVDDVAELPS